jgi:hypothetical protein
MVDAHCCIPGKTERLLLKEHAVTCCLQATTCLEGIAPSKKQHSCRNIQYVEKCSTTFNETQPSYHVSYMTFFSGKISLLQPEDKVLP